jgi:hypothetical protein
MNRFFFNSCAPAGVPEPGVDLLLMPINGARRSKEVRLLVSLPGRGPAARRTAKEIARLPSLNPSLNLNLNPNLSLLLNPSLETPKEIKIKRRIKIKHPGLRKGARL